MNKVNIRISGDKLVVGEMPRLVIDLSGGENYIETGHQRIPYHKQIRVSRDLLQGKRANVLQTAMKYYYTQACDVEKGYKQLEEYRGKYGK